MEIKRLAEGLWRWTAPHPEWAPGKGGPGGWERMVGCTLHEARSPSEGALVLVDPLAPPDGAPDATTFWDALDRDVERLRLPVAILLGNPYHQRSADAVRRRYDSAPGAATWAHADALPRLTCRVDRTFDSAAALPGGVSAVPIVGLDVGEAVFFLPAHGALVFADALVGTPEGRVRVPPESWALGTPEGIASYRGSFRDSMRRLLDLPVERLLVSHGEPVLKEARAALQEALVSPAWGG